VYWLAGKAVEYIKKHQGLELGIERSDIEAVKLAGLLHDVGHGPFSHMFEREFLPRVHNGFTWSHEDMSVKMVQHIVDEHHIEIGDECLLKKVKVKCYVSMCVPFFINSQVLPEHHFYSY
jgi:HD superfamily phosphohydrolase